MSTDDTLTQLSTGTELTRRDALKLFGAGIAMLQAGCLQRAGEEIRPSVRTPETSPGTPRLFATSMTIDGYATGLLALAHAGRPTKIEGNPAHPASLGATLAVHQASVIELYDPHRLKAPKLRGAGTTWDQFRSELRTKLAGNLWLVLPPDGSPAIAAQLAAIRARFPRTRVVHHSVLDRREAYRGAALAFGNPLEQQLALDRADVVVSLDADFLASMPMSVRWSHDFALRRRAVESDQQPVRLFVVEPALTPTGSMADHRSALRASDIAAAAVVLVDQCNQLGIASTALPAQLRQAAAARLRDRRWIELAARALRSQPRRSAIVVGDRQPAAVHALLHRLSLALGNVGATTSFTQPVVAAPLGEATLADLAGAIRANQVDAVLAIETDPVHDAPPELGLAGLLRQVPLSVHAAHYDGETSAACQWQLPLSHFLECWGDARAWDGTRSTIQPLIRPIHDTLSRLELLAMLAGEEFPDDRMLVRRQFGSDADWHAALSEGVVANSAEPAVSVKPAGDDAIVRELTALLAQPETPIEIDLAPSPSIGDGRFANNPWLQELPHPITKQTWGNAALMSAATAKTLGVRS
jgi:molybdopterin-containing oxidoreductase family iron-sulfur binding subunit